MAKARRSDACGRHAVTMAGAAMILPLAALCPPASQLLAQAAPAPGEEAAAATSAHPVVYMLRYRPGPSFRQGTPLLQQDLRAHGEYIARLVRSGTILAAGPTMTEEGGLVLIRAASLEEARAVMLADPAVSGGIFVGEISDWQVFFDPAGRFDEEAPGP